MYPANVALYGIIQGRIFESLRREFDVVHLHQPISPPMKAPIPLLATFHSSCGLMNGDSIENQNFYSSVALPPLLLRLVRDYVRQIERRTIESADLVTAVSHALAKEMSRLHGIDEGSIGVIGNGVDTNLFCPPREVKVHQPYVLYTGRLSWNKGLFDLVRSAKLVVSDNPNVKFVLTGRGPIEADLRKLIARMGLSDKFSFPGYVDTSALIRYYQNATAFVFPSYYEGFPTSLLEAMSCGSPVVTTDVGGVREVVTDGHNGMIVPLKNPEAIARSVLTLLEDEKLRKKLGNAGRDTIQKHYSFIEVTNKILRYYGAICS
jgi:glycosyltransferase involved in cell wall biosynthesis